MTVRGVILPAERERLRTAAAGVDSAVADLKAAVQAVWRSGGSVRAIAAELGKSTRTIQNWLQEVRQEEAPPPPPSVAS